MSGYSNPEAENIKKSSRTGCFTAGTASSFFEARWFIRNCPRTRCGMPPPACFSSWNYRYGRTISPHKMKNFWIANWFSLPLFSVSPLTNGRQDVGEWSSSRRESKKQSTLAEKVADHLFSSINCTINRKNDKCLNLKVCLYWKQVAGKGGV